MGSLGLDSIDWSIVDLLQQDGRMSHSAIAERVGLSQPAVHERVKKLEQRGVIRGYAARIDAAALDYGVLAFISVAFHGKPVDVYERVALIPHVMEAHRVAGEDCLLVKVRCRSMRDLERVVEDIWDAGPVASTRTTIALSSYKETSALPIDGRGGEV